MINNFKVLVIKRLFKVSHDFHVLLLNENLVSTFSHFEMFACGHSDFYNVVDGVVVFAVEPFLDNLNMLYFFNIKDSLLLGAGQVVNVFNQEEAGPFHEMGRFAFDAKNEAKAHDKNDDCNEVSPPHCYLNFDDFSWLVKDFGRKINSLLFGFPHFFVHFLLGVGDIFDKFTGSENID